MYSDLHPVYYRRSLAQAGRFRMKTHILFLFARTDVGRVFAHGLTVAARVSPWGRKRTS